MPQRLFLVDASGYIFRAYYAIRPLSNSKGLPTNALYGFTAMLLKLLREEKPDLIGIVFDVARKTFRNEKFPAYKANRSDPPPDLVPQFPYFRKIVRALNLPVLELPNYEADDVIGTIARKFERKGWNAVIVTGDKDMMQLVDDETMIYDSMKEKWIRRPEVVEKFGVGPERVADVLALAGDSSDNIPGVPGIGDKTATKLVQEYGPLEEILKQAGAIKGKVGEKLIAFADQARLCKELATIVTDVPLDYDLKDFEIREPDPEVMRDVFGELEFKNILREFGLEAAAGSVPDKSPVRDKEISIGNYLLDPDHRSAPIHDPAALREAVASNGLSRVYNDIELPLVPVLETMEKNGVKVDARQLQKSSVEYGERLKELEGAVYREAGEIFNLNSPKQLSQVLFQNLKLPVIRKNKTGYSTDIDVLTELAEKHPVPKLILEYRSLAKLKSTYLDALPALISPDTGRIHTSFNQTVAATGRLSSSNPNLQNIPIRSEEGRKIREAFIGENGCVLLSADYSQIELRVLAHLSKDPILIQAFREDLDVHRATAAGIFNVSEKDVTRDQRAAGKTVNFAVLYGQGAYSLSQQLEVSIEEAENYIRNYFSRYQGVARFKEDVLAQARREKIVRTLYGRLRRCPDIEHKNANLRAFAERTAFNTVLQGTAADLMKIAMIHIHSKLSKDFPASLMILQVHDELVFEVPAGEQDPVSRMVRHEMENAATLDVPLKVDVGAGRNWAEAH